MNVRTRFTRHLPALGVLLLLTLLSFHRLAFENGVLVGYDVLTYFYPNESYAAGALRSWRLPLWNPYLFTGVPFLANIQTAVFYPPNLLFLFLAVPRAYAYSLVLHVFLAAAFAYCFAVGSLRLRSLPAITTAAVYAFGGFLGALSGHLNQLQASAWLPMILLSVTIVYRRRSLRWVLLGGVSIASQFLAGHMQEVYMSMVAVVLYVLWLLVCDFSAHWRAFAKTLWRPIAGGSAAKGNDGELLSASMSPVVLSAATHSPVRSRLLALAVMAVLGLGLCAVQFLPTLELTRESIRAAGMSYQDSTSFSLPPWLLLRALLPAYGDPQLFSEWIGYVGVFGLVLALLALLRKPRHTGAAFFVALALLSLFLALGQFNPLYPLAYKLLPGIALFRVPARWLLLYSLALAALAGMGVQSLLVTRAPASACSKRKILIRVFGVALGIMSLFLFLALVLHPGTSPELPSVATTLLWAGLLLVILAVIAVGLRAPGRLAATLATFLVAGDLVLAGQGMDFNRVNLPDVATAMRPAIAHLLSQPGIFRVLPLSEGTFDPGDLAQLRLMLEPILPADAAYDYAVATKHKETLTPNLPLLFRIPSIDGYDGGVLPLRRYVDLKGLLPLTTANLPDGRLREQLATMPDLKWLSWLNVKYVLMDRVRDAWVDGVYYDLALSRDLSSGQSITLGATSDFQATSVGVISHLEGGKALPDGASVANLVISMVEGDVFTATLRAGTDTSEGRYAIPHGGGQVAHAQAKRAMAWRGVADAWDYSTRVALPRPGHVARIEIVGLVDSGKFVLRGVSVVDGRRSLNAPIVIDPALKLTHLGDVKIYENSDAAERAFLAHDVVAVPDDAAVLSRLAQPGFDPVHQVVLTSLEMAKASTLQLPFGPSTGDYSDRVSVQQYDPEAVHIASSSDRAGLLVLTDSYYPGWRATVDGLPVPVLRVDHLFRAVSLPPGQHEVVFIYRPDSLRLGAGISIATVLVLVILFVVAMMRGRRDEVARRVGRAWTIVISKLRMNE